MDVTFRHRTHGTLQFDPRPDHKQFDPWWALLVTEEDIIDLYRWFLKKRGLDTEPNKLWGPHVSMIKGDRPADLTLWGTAFPPVEFWYTNEIRYDNAKHAWLDVFSPEMSDIRVRMGLSPKCFYHLTLGRLK
jgi:hypothetical protein